MREEIIRLEKITQIIGGVTLLDSLNLHIFKNEIFGLLCINNHGKEALIDLICYNNQISFGNVYFLDNLCNSYTHSTGGSNEVLVIEKPIRLVDALSVADNIYILHRKNRKKLNEELQHYLDYFDIDISASALVADLSFYQKCVVLLLKAYIMDVKLVILRDISNFISSAAVKEIHDLLKKMAIEKMTFLFICNNHEEAFAICDRIALMENGSVIKILNKRDFNDEVIKFHTLNFEHNTDIDTQTKENVEAILSFEEIHTENLHELSCQVYKGECVTLLDTNGTAINDIVNLLNASLKPRSGTIVFNEKSFSGKNKLLRNEIEFIIENPTQTMVFSDMSYIDNLCFLIDKKLKWLGEGKKIKRSIAVEYQNELGEDLLATDIFSLNIISLYNLVYYRMHLLSPSIVVCVQPFSGADITIRHHIVYLINKLLEKEITIIILTVSVSDSLYVSDRLLVLEQGTIKEEYNNKDFHKYRRDN